MRRRRQVRELMQGFPTCIWDLEESESQRIFPYRGWWEHPMFATHRVAPKPWEELRISSPSPLLSKQRGEARERASGHEWCA